MSAKTRDKRGTWLRALSSLLLSVTLIMSIRWALFEPYIIPSESMVPTLLINDHILVNKFAYGLRVPFTQDWLAHFSSPRRGEIIVFRSVEDPQTFLIKRVIGLPGEKIEATSGEVKINGQAFHTRRASADEVEKFLRNRPEQERTALKNYDFQMENLDGLEHIIILKPERSEQTAKSYTIPANQYFMMGDNRDNSADSRYWGTLPIENVLGRATHIWLSCEKMAEGSSRICDFSTLRGERIFSRVH